MKRLLVLLVSTLLVLAGCSGSSAPTSSLEDGVLTVGMECDYAPYNYTTTEENKAAEGVLISGSDSAYCNGYDVMIATEIANQLGVELEVKKIPWDGLIPALESGQIDAIIAGMSPTEERMQTISFTDSYYEENIEMGMIVTDNSQYATATTINDFEGATISAQLGTLQEELLPQITGATVAPSMPDYATLQQAVLSGQIDGYLAEEQVALETEKSDENLQYIPLPDLVLDPSMNTSAIGVRKDDVELQEQINEVLATITIEEREAMMAQASEDAGQ